MPIRFSAILSLHMSSPAQHVNREGGPLHQSLTQIHPPQPPRCLILPSHRSRVRPSSSSLPFASVFYYPIRFAARAFSTALPLADYIPRALVLRFTTKHPLCFCHCCDRLDTLARPVQVPVAFTSPWTTPFQTPRRHWWPPTKTFSKRPT